MKEKVSYTIEEEIIKQISKEAKKQDLSASKLVNNILIKFIQEVKQ